MRPQRYELWRLFAVRKASKQKSDVDAGALILYKPEVIQRAISVVQVQRDMGAREPLLVAEGPALIGATFECHRDCNGRWRCRNEIPQREPDDTHNTEN